MSTSILHRAGKRHAYIVFVDESGFMLAPLRRRTWAPRGCTPIIKISEPHGRISVIESRSARSADTSVSTSNSLRITSICVETQ
jgi:hypothetical protein